MVTFLNFMSLTAFGKYKSILESWKYLAVFLLELFILSVQLSLASPGLTRSLLIIFGQLGLPTEYVGVFNACNIVTKK